MDAQGIMRVEGVGKVSLISIVDVVSRLKAESYPTDGSAAFAPMGSLV